MLNYYSELDKVNSIEIYLPFSSVKEEYIIPDSYYINSLGLLYNCFGEDGHKEANLIYTYKLIKDYFYDKKYVSLNRDGRIDLFKTLNDELIKYRRILKTGIITRNDVMNYIHMDCCNLKDPLLIKLVVGIISSKISLLKKFIEFENKSSNKKEDMEKIISLSGDDIRDILVRFCGFHKIESQRDKVITTTSFDLNSFINYFNNGFDVEVVSGIDLYSEVDELYKMLVVDQFLDKNPQYASRVKVRNKFISSDLL